ncbi:glycosyltransferase [Mycolicibacterium goodii]|uniref:glycosyltransferase n=1 Tax=Mycolicibacterium goodii TaxID=134601 RepID=UPI00093A2F20|nr:glycosyltransferase [Mycolicibacterium goodii]MBU8814600.1 glycosyltransferase [Mycolicibacterium goodii]OKH74317.1 glycosyl transferase family 1 [Mycobacterium sp. SWH-M5]ULN48146.1 glycosyltransferase [Mycolicibacterium goodii]
MKFVMASYGTRGDIEPSLVVGRELLRRGHEVCLAVAPDAVDFVEAAGVPAVPFGLDTRTWLNVYRNFWNSVFKGFWKINELRALWKELWERSDESWAQMSATLTELTADADVLFAGQAYQETAANVAEHFDIPLVTLHHVPVRPNGRLVPVLPPLLGRTAMQGFDWFTWLLNKKVEDTQRRELGLPKARIPSAQRIGARRSLEIQAYDEVCFPGLAREWAKWGELRPFVGALTMELSTDVDDEVSEWIAAGTPPICFGFGSMPVESPTDTVEMISAASAQLGERALICAGYSDFSGVPSYDHVKVVGAVNYGAVFPLCRAVVHHGGSGTTAASMRAGVPTLILSMDANQTLWGSQIKKLKVGTTRRFSATNPDTLITDLRRVLEPECATRARNLAAKMTKPADGVRRAADLVENFARVRSAA